MNKIAFTFILCCAVTINALSGWAESIAFLKFSSYHACDITVDGLLEGMAANGLAEGDALSVAQFDAEGDLDALAVLAAQIANGDYDLIVTLSTPALQAVAAANTETQVPHLFTFITSPYIADVGVETDGTKPAYMTGNYNPNPVGAAFQLAQEMNPPLNKVGLVWNPAEANSVYQTEMAREICANLNIGLIEENVSATEEVSTKVQDAIAQGIQAIYMNADNTVSAAIREITQAAKAARIPVFIVGSGGIDEGTLFDLGPDYHAVGYNAGEMAARILDGESPTDIPVFEYITESLYLNLETLNGLNEEWTVTENMKDRAVVILGASAVSDWELYF